MSIPNRKLGKLVLVTILCTLSIGSQTPFLRIEAAAAQDLIEMMQEEAEQPEAEAEEPDPASLTRTSNPTNPAFTTEDPTIPVDELKLLVRPLTKEELEIEAQAWLLLLQAKVREISTQEIAIKRKNLKIEQTEEAVKNLEEAKKTLEEAKEAEIAEGAGSTAVVEKTQEAEEALKKAQESVQTAVETEEKIQEDKTLKETVAATVEETEKTAAEKTDEPDALKVEVSAEEAEAAKEQVEEAASLLETEVAPTTEPSAEGETGEPTAEGTEATPPPTTIAEKTEKVEKEEKVEEQLQQAAEAEAGVKQNLVVEVTTLQNEQTALADRFKVILDALDQRGGETTAYRKYIDAVSVIEIDVKDTQGLGVRVLGWLRSPEGGLRWARNLGIFSGVVVGSLLAAWILGAILNQTLKQTQATSKLMREFLVVVFRRGTVVVGVLLALTALEVSLGPVLALLGGASFILAFALQSNLGNLASGLMLMINRPFDVGDEVKIDDMWVFVDSISLANSRFKGWAGELITMPNDAVWNSTIANLTHAPIRQIRHHLLLELEADIAKAKDLFVEVMKSHPKVLKYERIEIFFHEIQDEFIPMYVSAWTNKEDFWPVYQETLIMIRDRFRDEGISLCDPIQDIRIHYAADDSRNGRRRDLSESIAEAAPSLAKNN